MCTSSGGQPVGLGRAKRAPGSNGACLQTTAGSDEPGQILPELSQKTASSKVLLQGMPERDLP
ncbi:hypothetical protein LI169_10320 [Desulfovibrio desulfuricans]|nr:hypothetical protein [Desulfovibrio desulfuricans]